MHLSMLSIFQIAVGWLYATSGTKIQAAWLCFMACDHPPSSWSQVFRGVWVGHDRDLIWRSFIQTLIDLAPWQGALSGWKNQCSELENTVRAEGSQFSFRTTLFMTWFVCLSQRQMCPIPALLKHPQIITDTSPKFTVGAGLSLVGLSRSLSSH